MDKKLKSIPRCPKCGSKPHQLTEMWMSHAIAFDLEEKADGTIPEAGDLHPGDPDHVIASCGKCKHEWRVRGVSQIIDFKEHPSNLRE